MALTQKQVSELYVAIFNRASEGEGNKFWQTSQTGAAAANDMLATTDAKAYFGTSLNSNQAFIEHIYSNTLNKTYAQDKAGIDFWVNALNSGMSRGEVVASLVAAVADYSSSTDPVTKAAYDQFNNRVEVSNYMANTVEKAPANYATSTKFATSGATGLVVTNSASTVTTAKTSVDTMKPVPGQTFTLTTGADNFALTNGDDTVTGTVGTLNATDTIIDNSTTDKDTLTVSVNENNVKATIKNIEDVKYNWAAIGDIAVDATNMTGNTFTFKGENIAFAGGATVTEAGSNNFNFGDTVTGTAALTNVVKSTINAGQASAVTVDGGTPTLVGQKTTAAITTNKAAVTVSNLTGDLVDELTLTSTVDATIKLQGTLAAATGIDEKLTVTGANNVTIQGVVTGSKIVNEKTSGTLTVKSTDAAATDVSKISANTIQLTANAGAITVGANQVLEVLAGAAPTTIDTLATLSNVETTIKTNVGIAALNLVAGATDISKLNLVALKDVTVGLTAGATQTTNVSGAGKLTLNATGVSSVDASAATGDFTYSKVGDTVTGVTGSSTAKNTINLSTIATANATFIGGSNVDTVSIAAAAGTIKINTGAGDDKVTVSGALTGKATIDLGAGTNDVVTISNVNGVATAAGASQVSFVGVEEFEAITNTVFNNVQLSGQTYKMTGAGNSNLNVIAYDSTGTATALTTDLSGLTFNNISGKNFSTVNITGKDSVVDTIKGSKVNDTIDAGTGADIIDITSGGNDTIVVAAGDSIKTAMDKVSGFTANLITAEKGGDTLDIHGATAVVVLTAGVAGVGVVADNTSVASAISGGIAGDIATATLTNGFMTISGADANKIDTLSEWITAAGVLAATATEAAGDTLAFKFDGNTYIYAISGNDATANFDVIELTGLSTATAIGTAAAENTILLA